MSKSIPETLRRAVAHRASFRCEYCRRPEIDSFIRYQSDHIVSRKHGGKTILENLAHTCPICNNAKGSDLSTILEDEGLFP
jgi:5-methylcytosine-specific restriction endonuclease McrA